MTLKFNRILEVVELQNFIKLSAAVHELSTDFGQLWTSIAIISGTDQAIHKLKTALANTIFLAFDENNLVNFGPLTNLDVFHMTLKFNRVRAVVKVNVRAKYHQPACSGS